MVQQLLQKTRTKFLQITPPENLVPNKRIGKREKRQYNRRVLYNQHYRSLINHRYFAKASISRKENTPYASASLNLLLRFAISDFSWHVEKMQSVIQPKKHYVIDRLNQVIGRSIVNFLATPNTRFAKAKTPTVGTNKKLAPHVDNALQAQDRTDFYHNVRNSRALLTLHNTPSISEVSALKTGVIDAVTPLHLRCQVSDRHSGVTKGSFTPPTNREELPIASIAKNRTPFFYIQWDNKKPKGTGCKSLVDFLRNQLFGNFWNYLFSIHDINRKRNRVNDQFKNQYIEYKKLAILYGNLPRRTFAQIMRRATKEGGEIESKFLFILERRLDVILKRVFFFPTIKSARQWIHQGKILVNNQICTYNGYLLQPADLISIKKEYIIIWRKEWFKHFHIIARNSAARGNQLQVPNVLQFPTAERIEDEELPARITESINSKSAREIPGTIDEVTPDTVSVKVSDRKTVYKKRRFLFSPSLMQKWSVWSKLWGSINCNSAVKKETHRWSRKCYMQGNFSHTFFNSSALAPYLDQTKRRTGVVGNCAELSSTHNRVDNAQQKRVFFNRFPTATIHLLHWLSKKLSSEPRRNRERKNQHFMQFFSALLSLKQQSRVVDGCFQHRWNKILIKKKLIVLKKKDWQWSCIKPMHFECSYRRPSAIYLYPPQKLVWPTSINVLLLKTALN